MAEDKQTVEISEADLETICIDLIDLADRLGIPLWAVYASEPLPKFGKDGEAEFTLSMQRERGSKPGALKLTRTVQLK